MANTLTLDDKFQRRLNISATGSLKINPCAYRAVNEIWENIRTENILKVTTEGLTAGTSIDVLARIDTETNFTTIGSITGSDSEVFDISTWDHIRFDVVAFDGTVGKMATSAFFSPGANITVNCDGGGSIGSDVDQDGKPDGSNSVCIVRVAAETL